MSSQLEEKTEFIVLTLESYKEESINFSNIVIPFSNFGMSKKPEYIYEGIEKILFKERHPIYKSIFLDEFVE